MKIVAIIQARMGSSRLPGKMLLNIAGKPAIEHVVERLKPSQAIDAIWIATTDQPADDQLSAWATQHQIPLFRGSEHDVLDRYYQTARAAQADVVVRVTGDCPLIDYAVVDNVIGEYCRHAPECDYVSNIHPPTFPDGLDTEVFSFDALERAWHEAKLPSEREHVTPYIWKHPELFRLRNVANDRDASNNRWTLDTPEDLSFLQKVIAVCDTLNAYVHMQKIVEIVASHPEWLAINSMHERNEGYKKSLAGDDTV